MPPLVRGILTRMKNQEFNMKIFRDILRISLLTVTLCAGITACDLSEDTSDCAMSVRLTFHCTSSNGNETFGTRVPSLSVFVFDGQGLFYDRRDEMDSSKFGADYTMSMMLPRGKYSFVVWGGLIDDNYYLGKPEMGHEHELEPVVGETHVDDFALRMSRTVTRGHNIGHIPGALFFGSEGQVLIEPGQDNNIEVFMLEYTKTINLTVIGLPDNTEYDITLHSPNGDYGFDGDLTADRTRLTYTHYNPTYSDEPLTRTSTIRTLRMVFGLEHTLEFYDREAGKYYNPKNGQMYDAGEDGYQPVDILRDYIRKTNIGAYNTQASVDAESTFNVTIDLMASAGVTVTVNDYTVNTTGHEIQ